jgi:hypothetical protein
MSGANARPSSDLTLTNGMGEAVATDHLISEFISRTSKASVVYGFGEVKRCGQIPVR